MSDKNTTYKVNQKIVYPSQGVGTIQEIKEKKFKDQMILYYVIYLDVSDMTVMIPVEKSDELGIRAIVSKEEALNAIEMIGQEFEPITSDWKLRYQMNLELLKKGSINDIASIVRCLYHRSKVKELPILERKLYDSAKKLLEDEISYSLEKTSKEVEAMIIIGGKNSSNTHKLYEVACKENENCIIIQDENDKKIEECEKYGIIGIMSGASTPDETINKVVEKINATCQEE